MNFSSTVAVINVIDEKKNQNQRKFSSLFAEYSVSKFYEASRAPDSTGEFYVYWILIKQLSKLI